MRTGRRAAQRAAEHRVVPLHGPTVLADEQVGVVGDRVTELADGDLPLGLRVVEVVRQRQRAAQAVVCSRIRSAVRQAQARSRFGPRRSRRSAAAGR